LLNNSAPPLSMRLPRDVLPPHCPSEQLTIALKRRFSCSFCTRTLCTPSGSRATCLRSAFARVQQKKQNQFRF
jgi:ribosomal protein S27E